MIEPAWKAPGPPEPRLPSASAAADDADRRPLRAWVAWAIAIAVTATFFLPSLSPDRQFGYFDNGRMHVPMKRYIADELAAGRFPAWNPWSGLGAPIAAGGVDAVQHPFNLLLVALPFDLGFKLWVLLCFPIAAVGAFAWARRLGARDAPALVAGLAFALSGYVVSMTGNMQYLGALAFFPWVLAAGADLVARPGPGRAALAAVASGLCAASGDPQGWAIAVALVPAAAVVHPPAGVSRRRAALRAAGAVIACGVGALPFVAPIVAWIPESGRGEAFDAFEHEMFSLLPGRALELVVPDLFRGSGRAMAYELYEAYAGSRWTPLPWALSEYVGASVVALAVLGAVRRPLARTLLGAAAAFTWMAMGSHAGFGQIARHLPVLGNLRYWEKLAVWPALLCAAAAAIGVDALLSRTGDARRFGTAVASVGGGLLALGLLATAFPDGVARALPAPGPPASAAALLALNVRDGLLHAGAVALVLGIAARLLAAGRLWRPALALGAIVVLDLCAVNVRAYVLSDVDATRPASPLAAHLRARPEPPRLLTPYGLYREGERYTMEMEPAFRLGAQVLYAAWNVPERVGNFQIWSGMLPARFNRYWRRMGRRDELPGVGMWSYAWLYVPPAAGRDLARVARGASPAAGPEGLDGTLARLPARPRAYLAQALEAADRRRAMEFVLDPAHVATDRSVVEGPVPPGYAAPGGEVHLEVDAPDRVVLSARADRPALVVLNDIYTSGWTVEVDGAPAEIVPVNYLARGVWIPPGEHRVAYRYRTPWLRESWALLFLAALGTAAWGVRRFRARAAGGAPATAAPLGAPRDRGANPAPAPASAPDARARAPSGRALARAALVYAGVLALFFAPALAGLGDFMFRDSGRMHGPHKRFVAERLARGDLPEWNPYGGLGFPLVAGAVDAVQHPFNALLVLLPEGAGFTSWVVLSALLAALGTFAWARALGAGDAGALAAGLAIALGGFLVSSTDNLSYLTAYASVPLLLATAHGFVERPGPRRAALVAAASGFAAAAGDPQSWGMVVGLLPLYSLALVEQPGSRRRDRLARGALALVVAAVGAAPFLLPVAAWMVDSSRGDALHWIERARYNLLPVRLLELGVPGLVGRGPVQAPVALYQALAGDAYSPRPWVISEYAGATVLALAALGGARRGRVALLLGCAAVFAWAAMGTQAGWGQIAAHLPILRSFRYWEKVAFFTALLVAAAAAHGATAWLAAPEQTRRFGRIVGGVAAAALAGAAAVRLFPSLLGGAGGAEAPAFADNVWRGLLHAGLALGALASVGALATRGLLRPRARATVLCAVVALDLALANTSAYVLTPRETARPRSRFAEVLGAAPGAHRIVTPFPIPRFGDGPLRSFEHEMVHGAATLHSGWNVDYRIGNFDPYTGMLPARLMRFRLRTGWMNQHPQVGMWGVSHAVIPLDDPDPGRMRLGPPWTVDAEDLEHRSRLVRIPHRPRVYLAEEVTSVDRRAAMEFVLDPASVTTSRSVVEGPVPPGTGLPRGSARLALDEPERVDVRVENDRTALLVLNDMLAGGWSATVDGEPAEILPANYLARGVWVPPGVHTVAFRYSTPLLREGWLVLAAGGLALALWGLRRRRGR